ncbi:MAG: SPOR domain-containing protein [Alphaproteobacteria bacterium]|nr:SPOR domain-containing protein [Alphaproteobacteria bacterium]
MSDRYRDRDDEEADLDLDESEPPKRRGRLLAALVALFAVGGFGGVLWYAYSQGQRSADAVAPILKADGEPSRVRPEQPGGMVVPHQDKLVLNNMQQASRPGSAERLLPPAEAPLPQTLRTAPPPAASVTIAPAAAPPPPPAPPPPAAAVPMTAPPPSPPPAAPPTVVGGLIAPPAPPPVAPAPSGVAAPPPHPAAAQPPQMAARPSAPPVAATSPSRGGSGEWRVQLGSFPAVDQASAQWDRLKKAHTELQPLGLTTVRVDLGDKGVWFRLQAGPLNEPAARALCDDLKSRKRDCLVVRP